MAYTPNPTDPTRPTAADFAGNMYLEFQALKAYIQTLLPGAGTLGAQASLRNRLDNSSFQVQQRGAGPFNIAAGTNAYTADRWNVIAGGSQVTAAFGTGVNSNTTGLTLFQAASGVLCNLLQRIESFNCVDMVVGTQWTLSGWIATTGIPPNPTVSLGSPGLADNYGGSATLAVAANQALGLTSITSGGYTYFKNTFTLTADATKGLQVAFGYNAGLAVGQTVTFSEIQFEKGGFASNYEVRPAALEVEVAQRFYQVLSYSDKGLGQSSGPSRRTVQLQSPMRAVPAVATAATTYTNVGSPTITPTVSNFHIDYTNGSVSVYELTVTVALSADL